MASPPVRPSSWPATALATAEPERRLPGRNRSKADLLFYDLDGRPVAVKSYARQPWWIRHTVGRFFIRRESAALAAAAGAPGVPELLGRIGPWALATEWLDARPVSSLPVDALDAALFSRAAERLGALHSRGVAHGDLHHRDLLVGPGGEVYFVDFATALVLGERPGRLRRALFERLCEADRVNLARIRARCTGGDSAAAVAAVGARAAGWHRRGRRLKGLLDRLRGKRRGREGRGAGV